MKRTMFRVALAATVATATVVGIGPAAHADEDPRNRPEKEPAHISLDFTNDPLSGDALVTDDMEAQVDPLGGSTVTCKYESVITAANSAPSSPSFQLLYVLPAGEPSAPSLDVPRSCSDGSVRYSSVARASRNLATWQERRAAGLNYRTLNITYKHNYTGATYSTRGVRRFHSQYSRATWESYAVRSSAGSSPRLSLLAQELANAGFDVSNTRYSVVLHTDAELHPDGSYTVGVAQTPGRYGFATRTLPGYNGYPDTTIRYGCASTHGDAFLAHEATHQVGGGHVSDNSLDLMLPSKPQANFNTSPYLRWDYNLNDYHPTVSGSVYVNGSGLPGNYYTC